MSELGIGGHGMPIKQQIRAARAEGRLSSEEMAQVKEKRQELKAQVEAARADGQVTEEEKGSIKVASQDLREMIQTLME